jgi:hypothetical protein
MLPAVTAKVSAELATVATVVVGLTAVPTVEPVMFVMFTVGPVVQAPVNVAVHIRLMNLPVHGAFCGATAVAGRVPKSPLQ